MSKSHFTEHISSIQWVLWPPFNICFPTLCALIAFLCYTVIRACQSPWEIVFAIWLNKSKKSPLWRIHTSAVFTLERMERPLQATYILGASFRFDDFFQVITFEIVWEKSPINCFAPGPRETLERRWYPLCEKTNFIPYAKKECKRKCGKDGLRSLPSWYGCKKLNEKQKKRQ